MGFFDKLKSLFSCENSDVVIRCKSKCLSNCCRKTEIDIDVDGDNKPDIIIKKNESDFEVIVKEDLLK